MVDVFISYSRRDQTKVAMLARAIADEGYEVWWDEELPPHRSYGDVITDKIATANAALVVWSKDSVQSEWVRAEADMARNQSKLIQTSLDDVMPPLPFNQIQNAAIGDWQGEADHSGWRKVKVSLADLCGPRSGDENAGRGGGSGPDPVPPLRPPSAAAAAPSMPRRPLFAWIAVAGIVLIGAGAVWVGQRDKTKAEPGQETAASRFELLATVAASSDGYTNVRDAPSISGRILARVQAGKAFTTYDQPGTWWHVRLPDGTTGFIARSRILLSGETGAAGARSGDNLDHGGEAPAAKPSGMIFPDSSTRLLVPSELAQLSSATLRVARNEIYARKGRRFRDSWLRRYFGQFAWYQPRYDEVSLNRIEQRNVATISTAEARFR